MSYLVNRRECDGISIVTMALREKDISTGLYTPGFFVAFGARELSFARESGYPVSLVTIRIEEDLNRLESDDGSQLRS